MNPESAPTLIQFPPTEEQLAAALDEAIDACHAGQTEDLHRLLALYPQLGGALALLEQLAPPAQTSPALRRARPAAHPVPEQIGPYRIERELGAGGFGIVYRAYDPDLKRHVALKILHPGRLNEQEAVNRFHREACATARLRHDGIVRLYDHSRTGPPYYLVTELVEGVDLRTWAKGQGLTAAEVADLVARVAEAVDHAHGQGVYHRDLKPGNILVDERGNPHVLDFGLARLYREWEEVSAPTSEGRILGTLAYMAPEQAAGRSHTADARTDVYSLGVIFYELLTGQLPFEGPVHNLPVRVMEDAPPSPRTLDERIPRDLEAVCLKALAKLPEERYASAAEMARDLRAFLRGEPVQAQPRTWVVSVKSWLGRRHRDVLWHDWSVFFFLIGLTILAGCALVNVWEHYLPVRQRLAPILLTKVIQVAGMLYFTVRFRPLRGSEFTSAEKQVWTLVPAYYGGNLVVLALNQFLDPPVPLAPILAVMSGMVFIVLGGSIWGWFYVCGLAFFILAILIAGWFASVGMLLVGVGWFAILLLGSLQLRARP